MSDVTIVLDETVEPNAWDKLAASVGGTYFHCHASAMYNAARSRATPLFVNAMNAGGQCVGVAAGTISASRLWPFSRFCKKAEFASLPAAADAESVQAVLAKMEDALRQEGIFSVGFASYDSPHAATVLSALGYDLAPRSEFYIDLTKDLDTIWAEFSRKRRRCIRRAGDQGVVTRCENTREAVEMVFRLHGVSMQRRGVEWGPSEEHIRLVCEHLFGSGVADAFVTVKGNTPVCAKLVGRFNGRACGLVSGASDLGYECFAAIEMVWATIRWYKEHGMTVLSLGGAKAEEEGLHEFKRQFGATAVGEPAGTKVLSRTGMRLDNLRLLVRKVRK